jgi:hypothetical protein
MHKIKLYTPTKDQLEIHNTIASGLYKIIVLVCGRRWGKNIFALNDMAMYAFTHKNKIVWWCSPVHRIAKRDYRRFVKGLKSLDILEQCYISELRVELKNGTVIEFYGLDDPDNLKGEAVDRWYVDEAAKVKYDAISEVLRPMLLDTKGIGICFGTPKGKNWFHKYYTDGLSSNSTTKSFHFKTSDNPFIDKKELEKDLKQLPQRVIDQEYNAQFLDAGSGVFAGYNECIEGDWPLKPAYEVVPGRQYRIGVDLAKHQDWTVFTVLDLQERTIVDFYRFNGEEYGLVKLRIKTIAERFNNAEVVIDSTGVGEPVYDDLVRVGMNIIPFKFTNTSKIALIEGLVIAIQNKSFTFPEIPELVNELDIFEIQTTPAGNTKYTAPAGYHDDCVISLALALWDVENIITDFKLELGEVKGNYNSVMGIK